MARMERFHGSVNICATSAARMAVLNASRSVMSDIDSPVFRMPSESARVKCCRLLVVFDTFLMLNSLSVRFVELGS